MIDEKRWAANVARRSTGGSEKENVGKITAFDDETTSRVVFVEYKYIGGI